MHAPNSPAEVRAQVLGSLTLLHNIYLVPGLEMRIVGMLREAADFSLSILQSLDAMGQDRGN